MSQNIDNQSGLVFSVLGIFVFRYIFAVIVMRIVTEAKTKKTVITAAIGLRYSASLLNDYSFADPSPCMQLYTHTNYSSSTVQLLTNPRSYIHFFCMLGYIFFQTYCEYTGILHFLTRDVVSLLN